MIKDPYSRIDKKNLRMDVICLLTYPYDIYFYIPYKFEQDTAMYLLCLDTVHNAGNIPDLMEQNKSPLVGPICEHAIPRIPTLTC